MPKRTAKRGDIPPAALSGFPRWSTDAVSLAHITAQLYLSPDDYQGKPKADAIRDGAELLDWCEAYLRKGVMPDGATQTRIGDN